MKPTTLLMAGVAVLALAACDGSGRLAQPTMKAVSKLDCPDRQGDLRRVSAAADGKSCNYTDNDGGQVTLQLVAVSGDADAALKPIEASLAALVPDINAPPPAAEAAAEASAAAKAAAASQATAASDAGTSADDADADADADVDTVASADDDENVQVDLPGLHVRAKGDKADVRVLGMKVHVDEKTDSVHVRRGKPGGAHQIAVDANDNGAVIRLQGGSSTNLKSRVIFAMDRPGPQGDRVVGYVARGPRTGPLVVATVRSKRKGDHGDGDHDINDDIFDDAARLTRKASRG